MLNSNSSDYREAEQMTSACEDLQPALLNLNIEQSSLFNTVVGTVYSRLTRDNIRQAPSEVPSLPSVHDRPQKVKNSKDFIEPPCFSSDAHGGAQKTYYINAMKNCPEVHGKSAVAVATSPLAAKGFKDGMTAHSAFKIPVSCGVQDIFQLSVICNDS